MPAPLSVSGIAMNDVTETEFQRQVTDLAEMLGWSWAHFRPARTAHGWKVPVSGPLGAGWPDLTLVRDDRLVFVELKRSTSQVPSPDQQFTLTLLGGAAETYVWRPGDIDDIARVLGAPRSRAPIVCAICGSYVAGGVEVHELCAQSASR